MKIILALVAVLTVACGSPKTPAAESPAQPNAAEKYVGGLQTDVKLAQAAKEKADAAIKKSDDAQKELQKAADQ